MEDYKKEWNGHTVFSDGTIITPEGKEVKGTKFFYKDEVYHAARLVFKLFRPDLYDPKKALTYADGDLMNRDVSNLSVGKQNGSLRGKEGLSYKSYYSKVKMTEKEIRQANLARRNKLNRCKYVFKCDEECRRKIKVVKDWEKILEKYLGAAKLGNDGMGLSKKYKINHAVALHILKKRKPPGTWVILSKTEKILEAYQAGYNQKQIAKRFKILPRSLRNLLRRCRV